MGVGPGEVVKGGRVDCPSRVFIEGVPRRPLVRVKWKPSVRQTACPPTAFFHQRPCRRHTETPPATHSLSLTHTNTHMSSGAVFWSSENTALHPRRCHSLASTPAPPPSVPSFCRPHVPVNLLIKRHWASPTSPPTGNSLPLGGSAGRPVCVSLFIFVPRWLRDGPPRLID